MWSHVNLVGVSTASLELEYLKIKANSMLEEYKMDALEKIFTQHHVGNWRPCKYDYGNC